MLGRNEAMEPIEPIAHLLCTILKQYIHQCKCLERKGTEQGLINKIRETEIIEKRIAESKSTQHCINHNQKWGCLSSI